MSVYNIPETFLPFFNREGEPYFYLPDGQQVKLNFQQGRCRQIWSQIRPGTQLELNASDPEVQELIHVLETVGISNTPNTLPKSTWADTRIGFFSPGHHAGMLPLLDSPHVQAIPMEKLASTPLPDVDLLIVFTPYYDSKTFANIDALASQKRLKWLPLYLDHGLARFGPILQDKLDFHTLHQRLLASSFNPPLLADYWSYIQQNAIAVSLDEVSERWIASSMVAILRQLYASEAAESQYPLSEYQVTFNHRELTLQYHPVLPLPVRYSRQLAAYN